jgi:hypothetical protein
LPQNRRLYRCFSLANLAHLDELYHRYSAWTRQKEKTTRKSKGAETPSADQLWFAVGILIQAASWASAMEAQGYSQNFAARQTKLPTGC